MSTEETINNVTVTYEEDINDNNATINTWSILLLILTLFRCLHLIISQVFVQFGVFCTRRKKAYQIRNTNLSTNLKEELCSRGTKSDEVCPHNAYLLEKEEVCMKVFAPNRKVPVTLTNGKVTFKTDTMFDTGCSVSMINSKLIAAQGLKPKPIKGYTVRDASGQIMPIDGAVNLEIHLEIGRAHV